MFPREINPFLLSDSPQIWTGPLHLNWTLEFLSKHNYALEVKRSSVSAHLRTREEYCAWEWSRHEQKMKQELEIKIKEKGRNFFISLLESWIQLVLHRAFVFSKLTNCFSESTWTGLLSFTEEKSQIRQHFYSVHIRSFPSFQQQQLGPKISHLFRGTLRKSSLLGSRDYPLEIKSVPNLLHLRIRWMQ